MTARRDRMLQKLPRPLDGVLKPDPLDRDPFGKRAQKP
jgi:hypothetical protein